MAEKKLTSGATLVVSPSDFARANELRKQMMRATKGIGIGPDFMSQDVSVLKEMIVGLASDDQVEAALFACFDRATYNTAKITRDLFDDPKIGPNLRRDYFEICYAVIEENVFPFFVQALSALKAKFPGKDEPQKQA